MLQKEIPLIDTSTGSLVQIQARVIRETPSDYSSKPVQENGQKE
jgi:hypothetical protein